MDRKLAALFSPLIFLLIFLPSGLSAPDHTLEIRLTLPEDSLWVHAPGAVEMGPGSSGTWPDPGRFYMAAYGNGIVYALVHSYQAPVDLSMESSPETHTLVLTQGLENSHAFLVFTQGGWESVENRMPLVESGTFLSGIKPAFGYSPGFLYPIKIVLEFPRTDLESGLILQKGGYELAFTNLGESGGKALVRPETV